MAEKWRRKQGWYLEVCVVGGISGGREVWRGSEIVQKRRVVTKVDVRAFCVVLVDVHY